MYKFTFGKFLLGKLHIWELALGKMPLGKNLTPKFISERTIQVYAFIEKCTYSVEKFKHIRLKVGNL